jgi:hypothetical protein
MHSVTLLLGDFSADFDMHILLSDKHTFTFPIPSGANLLIAGLRIGSNRQVDNRDGWCRHPEGHPRQLAFLP